MESPTLTIRIGCYMAGDWVVLTKDLPRKLEVLQVAKLTGRTPREVFAIFCEFWIWADSETADGVLPGIDGDILATLIGDTDATFWLAVCRVGWLQPTTDGLVIPNYKRWMGKSAKRRLTQNRSKQETRQAGQHDGDIVATNGRHPDSTNCRPEKRREEKSTKRNILTDVCPETQNVSGPPVLVFPCDGDVKLWHLTEALVAEMRDAYPSLDIVAECRKALAWVNASPDRRKTARGMRRFLVGWLSRTQDRGGARVQQTPPRPTLEDMADKLFGGQG